MKQFIKCPNCGLVQIASDGIHHCDKCSQWIYGEDYKPLKAISIQQPWAWFIANGWKDVENRSWITKFRGTVLIHASQKFDKEGFAWMQEKLETFGFALAGAPFEPKDYETGGIVGYADITDCVEKSDSPWFFGPKGFVLKNHGTLPFTPCKGKLSFFYPEILQ